MNKFLPTKELDKIDVTPESLGDGCNVLFVVPFIVLIFH